MSITQLFACIYDRQSSRQWNCTLDHPECLQRDIYVSSVEERAGASSHHCCRLVKELITQRTSPTVLGRRLSADISSSSGRCQVRSSTICTCLAPSNHYLATAAFKQQDRYKRYGTVSHSQLPHCTICIFLNPCKSWGRNGWNRPITYAHNACYRYPIYCSVSKREHLKGVCCRESRPNFVPSDPSPVKVGEVPPTESENLTNKMQKNGKGARYGAS